MHRMRFCNRVDAVIAPSVPVYNYLMQHGVKKPITVIPSPLRSDFLPATMHEKERGQRLQLLYVGRFVKKKISIRCLILLPNCHEMHIH